MPGSAAEWQWALWPVYSEPDETGMYARNSLDIELRWNCFKSYQLIPDRGICRDWEFARCLWTETLTFLWCESLTGFCFQKSNCLIPVILGKIWANLVYRVMSTQFLLTYMLSNVHKPSYAVIRSLLLLRVSFLLCSTFQTPNLLKWLLWVWRPSIPLNI